MVNVCYRYALKCNNDNSRLRLESVCWRNARIAQRASTLWRCGVPRCLIITQCKYGFRRRARAHSFHMQPNRWFAYSFELFLYIFIIVIVEPNKASVMCVWCYCLNLRSFHFSPRVHVRGAHSIVDSLLCRVRVDYDCVRQIWNWILELTLVQFLLLCALALALAPAASNVCVYVRVHAT